jgi:hypothetical protein
MAFGINTADYLYQINWAEFYRWKGEHPRFAGRYFGVRPYLVRKRVH